MRAPRYVTKRCEYHRLQRSHKSSKAKATHQHLDPWSDRIAAVRKGASGVHTKLECVTTQFEEVVYERSYGLRVIISLSAHPVKDETYRQRPCCTPQYDMSELDSHLHVVSEELELRQLDFFMNPL